MDAIDEHDDPQDDDDVAIHRARAKTMIDQIARDSKEALAAQGVAIDVFFLIPSSGDAVLIFGTTTDPSDDLWNKVRDVVAPIVRQSVGLRWTRCKAVACAATTDSVADHQPTPMSTVALQHAGAESDEIS
jgi:hypothetical protein